MALRQYANAPATTLANSCSAAVVSIQVASTLGFPLSYPYTLIIDKGLPTEEVVLVTGGSGTFLNVTRGYDGTTAFSHATGAEVVHGISAIDPREANIHVNASTAVHGVTGSVVGTSDTQTLTNKTVSVASNTINGLGASVFPKTDGTGKLVTGTHALPSGAVVGTTDVQTLTNKTLTSPTVSGGTFNNPPSNIGLPPGVMVEFAGSAAPSGWLLCDGSAVSRTTYAALFAVIGTTHGAGDGSTTFNLPDRRDRMGVGASGTKALGSTGGSATKDLSHTHTTPNHTHTDTFSVDNATISSTTVSHSFGGVDPVVLFGNPHSHGLSGSVTSSGASTTGSAGSTTQDVMNPYVALNYLIKV